MQSIIRHPIYRFILLLTLTGISISAAAGNIQTPDTTKTGQVTGVVTGPDNHGLPGVTISLAKLHLHEVTDENGRYAFKDIPDGIYTITFTCMGCKASMDTVRVQAKQTTKLNVCMERHPGLLQQVVVTGQYQSVSQQSSVYRVRVIDHSSIEQRHATDLLGILNTVTGIRLNTDQTLGETGISMMGMTGENIKILLDGVPLLDRGATRNSLSQIDIHLVDHIEIVEGPLSTQYGADALAGVINIITTTASTNSTDSNALNSQKKHWGIGLDLQEETAGKQYHFLDKAGSHNAHAKLYWRKNKWSADASVTRNNFGGWTATDSLNQWRRSKDWLPKEQWLYAGRVGYHSRQWQIWYRLNYLQENIHSLGDINPNTLLATDQEYLSNRSTHQLQLGWTPAIKWHLDGSASYQNYSRRTRTTLLDTKTNIRNLTADPDLQQESDFGRIFIRQRTSYRPSADLQLQLGLEFDHENGSGPRIKGDPGIDNYALFLSGHYRPAAGIYLQPGVRLTKNTIYDAPPVMAALNAKFDLAENLALRLSYARGFRAPALRELYFWFFDANHSIQGNTDLKAEYAHAFNASLTWQSQPAAGWQLATDLNGFYTIYRNRIDMALLQPGAGNIYTYINIARFKTTGISWNNQLQVNDWRASLGLSYTGRYNLYSKEPAYIQDDLPGFVWSPELTAALSHQFTKAGIQLCFNYKYTGALPRYELQTIEEVPRPYLAKTAAFHWLDFTGEKKIGPALKLSAGIKNIFNITELDDSGTGTGQAHSSSGPLPLSYGRSYFLGIHWNWH